MCAISGGYGQDLPDADMMNHRGPDGQGRWSHRGLTLEHRRLAILDPTGASAQPYARGNVVMVFNGEIWNYRALRLMLEKSGQEFKTTGDTEVLAAILDTHGIAGLSLVEGMFAVAWTPDDGETCYLARDRHGEIPLHVSYDRGNVVFSSELKAMPPGRQSHMLLPGYATKFSKSWIGPGQWPWYYFLLVKDPPETIEVAAMRLQMALRTGVTERTVSDVPVCALLSGGIDSAAIVSILRKRVPSLTCYTAVFDPDSRDLRLAREVASAMNVTLVEVPVPVPGEDDVRRIIRTIEMPHKAQIEIAWPCLHLARRIRADGFKVVYTGEGADELFASYGMSFHGIQRYGWYRYRQLLVQKQGRKNFARTNKVFMSCGVEARLPFLNTRLVREVLSLPPECVREKHPKEIMRRAFANAGLPQEVLDRPKLAFQDGLNIKREFGLLGDARAHYVREFRALYPNDFDLTPGHEADSDFEEEDLE